MIRLRSVLTAAGLSLCIVWLAAVGANAQTRVPQPAPPAPQPSQARLLLTVVDPTGGVIPAATVTVTGLEVATTALTMAPAMTSPQGVATITGLVPGRYNIQAEFQGFETNTLRDVRLRSGDNRQTIVLAIPRMQDSVTVGVDRQLSASDRGRTFGAALTREQIESLSDDPEEMKRQLQDIAGFNAVIRVDSFEGSELPPKAQIKSIHITRDAFAAENHGAGGLFVDIITQPGLGPIRGGLNFRLRDGSLSGRSPFAPTKGPEQTQNYGANFGGALIKERTSFSLSMSGTNSYDTAIQNAFLPGGKLSEAVARKSPRDSVFVSALIDHALTKDQTLRIGFNQNTFTSRNLGIGAYDLPERGYATDDRTYSLRVQEAGPLGRRFFTNTRMQLGWSDSESRSAVEAPTVIVTDAFTSGGQQRAGGRRSRNFNLASDLDYVRGIHSVRAGIILDGGWHRSDDRTNYLGTYTFESLEAYQSGQARSYTRRVGDPNVEYLYMTSGVYLQDDIRVRRNLTLSPGLRIEKMLHVNDNVNVGPRFGLTWAPFRSGRTSLRASAGIFYDWMASGTYEQTIRVDGFRQRELNIINPVFDPMTFDPGDVGITPAANRYLLGSDLALPVQKRLSAGVDQTLSSRLRVSVNYAYMRGSNVWRGNNLNAPVTGVRPDPTFANIVQVVSDGRSTQQTLNTNFSLNLARTAAPGAAAPVMVLIGRDGPPPPPPPPGLLGGPAGGATSRRFDWRRLSINGNYGLGRSLTNAAEGAFGLPATGTLDGEWGPAAFDVRHRFNVGINSSQLRSLNANLNMNASSGSPYTVRTGRDDNGDLVFNDRPAGLGRNSARAAAQWTLNGNFNYTIAFGRTAVRNPPGVQIIGTGGGAPTVSMINPQATARYRVGLNVSILNITNHANYGGYSGAMTSPFFGSPTSVTNPRKVDVGLNFSF